jgi:hypothetical protein
MPEGSTVHWLSYSHADQALLRDPTLEEAWDALVVPGTLATFYLAGTGGFVLTRGRPYIIDPRTPLLQTIEVARPEPKKSHLALAAIHDPEVPGIWPEREIPIEFWQPDRWTSTVERVIEFQQRYSSTASAKVDKYTQLLQQATGRTLDINPKPPHRIVPPYWAVTGIDDTWWDLSKRAIELTLDRCDPSRVMPILTLTKDTPIAVFRDLIGDLPDDCEAVFCWRGAWDEAAATEEDIAQWHEAVVYGHSVGVELTNLYGGFLSVLLTGLGLDGLNHGVGYSEQRDVRRLGATGAPPTRYYMPALRAFVSMANAQPIIDALPPEWACTCRVCRSVAVGGVPVVDTLSVEDLKRHFLLCRQREFRRVGTNLDSELAQLHEIADWLESHELHRIVPEVMGRRLALWASTVGDLR